MDNLTPITEAPAPAKPAKEAKKAVEDPTAAVRAAIARRDEAAARYEPDRAKFKRDIAEADQALMAAILAYQHAEQPDPKAEPVLAALCDLAARKDPRAVRLLMAERIRLKLPEHPDKDKPLGPCLAVWNGLAVTIPREVNLTLPEPIAALIP